MIHSINTYASDEALMEGIRCDESAAYKKLYVLNRENIQNYIYNNNGNYDDFKEIHQYAVCKVCEKIKLNKLELSSKLSTYVMGVAKNRWFNHLRDNGKLVPINEHFDLQDEVEDSEKEHNLTELMKTFDLLKDDCKKILKLRFWGKKRFEDIATTLNKKLSTVKMQTSRCLEKLKIKYTHPNG
jgi:RNA polymerase sigma factor (sigma-70 family)